MCEHIDRKLTFRVSQVMCAKCFIYSVTSRVAFTYISISAHQLEDGDIVCFQKVLPAETVERCRYPDVPSFLDYVHNRQVC